MSNKKSVNDVRNIVESEGLGYAVQSYLSGEDIKNKKLAELWQAASDALNAIEEFFDEEGV